MPATISTVLERYWLDRGQLVRSASRQARCIRTLTAALGGIAAEALTAADVRTYIAARRPRADGTVRRELIVLRAALRHSAREGLIDHARLVPMPPLGRPRTRWLRRSEAARLLAATRILRPRYRRELRLLVMLGLYTGTRRGALLALGWKPSNSRGWIDLEAGMIYRAGRTAAQTRKRQPPAPLPARLLPLLRAYRRRYPRARLFSRLTMHNAHLMFRRAAAAARLDEAVVLHSLRHTCATWMAQAGVPIWEAAGFLGMTVITFQAVYGHHHPAHLARAAAALSRRPDDGDSRRQSFLPRAHDYEAAIAA